MLMQCTETKKFIKVNIEAIQAGDKDAPIWILVDDEEDATNDPGWIGDDHTMIMIMFCKENYGSGSFTCYTPESDRKALSEFRAEQERLSKERESKTVVVGCGDVGRLGRKVALALAAHNISVVDSSPAMAIDDIASDFDGDSMLFRKGHDRLPKQKGYQPNHKQMRAMNKQAGRRGGRRR